MFNGKKLNSILSTLNKMEAKLNAFDLMAEKYEREVARLTEQNKQLMDRFMARDFENLQLYQTVDTQHQLETVPPEEDEMNAGEVLDIALKR